MAHIFSMMPLGLFKLTLVSLQSVFCCPKGSLAIAPVLTYVLPTEAVERRQRSRRSGIGTTRGGRPLHMLLQGVRMIYDRLDVCLPNTSRPQERPAIQSQPTGAVGCPFMDDLIGIVTPQVNVTRLAVNVAVQIMPKLDPASIFQHDDGRNFPVG
jgi:hypothetical protein